MTERVDEFRESIAIYAEMLRAADRDPWALLNIVDERLAQLSNHIAACHAAASRHSALAGQGFLQWHREKHLAEARSASDAVAQGIEVQKDLFALRHKVLADMARHYQRVD